MGDTLAEGSDTSDKKICPVCDEEVPLDVTVCPSCSTDLTLFAPEEDVDALPSDAEEIKSTLMAEDDKHISDMLKAADDDVLADPEETGEEDTFECPECGTSLSMDATSCSKCGVEFEIEEVFECPTCKSLIDINVNKCPECGTEFIEDAAAEKKAEPEVGETEKEAKPMSFAERMKFMKDRPSEDGVSPAAPSEPKAQKPLSFADRMKALKDEERGGPPMAPPEKMPAQPKAAPTKAPSVSKEDKYQELPKLIGEVKKLLVVAKKCDIDVVKNKALISQAVSASKKKDLENAIRLIKEGKIGLEKDLRSVIMSKQRTFTSAASLAKKGGKDASGIERILNNIKKSVEASDYSTAVGELQRAEEMAEGLSGAISMTKAEIDVIERTIQDALALNVNVSNAQSLFEDAKKAAESNDNAKVAELTKEINDTLMRILPRYIAKEMREAKADLRDIKMMNIDIGKPVDILKKANDSVRDGDYSSALHAIKDFKDLISKMQLSK